MSIVNSSPRDCDHLKEKMTTDTYFANGNAVQLFEQAFHRHLPVMLTGPAGCGKTRFVAHMGLLLHDPSSLSAATTISPFRISSAGSW
jgi:nitric oxide reductase NorQ protein